jgi:hypothetical protein
VNSTVSRPWTLSEGLSGGSHIAGYKTYATFLTQRGRKSADLLRFYSGDLPGWRRANWGRSFSGERSVCYRGSLASICARWLANVDPGEPGGVPFQVSVDSQAYAHHEGSP